jgi:hypothetical protein
MKSKRFMSARRISWTLFGVCLALLMSVQAYSQGSTATLLGIVTDTSGGVLPGVAVSAVNQDTGFRREAVTSGTGAYRLAALPPGTYDLTASLEGFASQTMEGIALILLQETTIPIQMGLATVAETVTVTAETPLIEITKSEVSGAVMQDQIRALPTSSRTFTDLALLLPGANADQRREWSDPVNIGSGSWHQTGFVMDGANNNWAATGESRMNFTQESVREFKVVTSGFKAEYGTSANGIVIGVSKSGTNQYNGSAYMFFRNDALRALGPFEEEKPDTSRYQYGGSVGGPIMKDRAFFFASLERLDERTFINVSSGGAYPSLEGQFEQPIVQDLGTFKFDMQISDSHQAFVRWALQRKDWQFQGVGGRTHPTASRHLDFPRDSVVGGITSVFGNKINDFRLGWSYTRAVKSPATATGVGYNFPSLTYGNARGWEFEWEQNIQIVDDFSWYVSGKGGEHDIKFGFALSPYLPNQAHWWGCTGGCYTITADAPGFPETPVDFDAMSATGNVPQLSIGHEPPNPKINYQTYGWYIQDDWSPNSRLTLNLGLRWDVQWNSMLHAIDGEPFIGTFTIPAVPGYYDRTDRSRDMNNFAPRFGFAYDLTGSGETVLRGNVGIYYSNLPNLPLYIEPRDLDGLGASTTIINNPQLNDWENPVPEVEADPDAFSPKPSITLNSNDQVNPSSVQFGVGLSHQLTPTFALNVDVVRLKGADELKSSSLLGRTDLNIVDPATGLRLSDSYGGLQQFSTNGRSVYNALLVRLDKRMSNDLQFMLSYTFADAKNMINSMWTREANAMRPDDEWGHSPADRRQRLTFSSITTAIPYGVQLSGVLTLGTNRPFDIKAGKDIDGDGRFDDRPPGITRNVGCRGLDVGLINSWRADNGLGNVGAIECEALVALDVRVSKIFELGGSNNLEFIFEIFNLTGAQNREHSQSQGVATDNALSASFGQAIVPGGPRQAQVALRFSF